MNLGTLLSKPGESNYSVYRRFLIANPLKNVHIDNLLVELKTAFEELFHPEIEYPGHVQAILMIEGKKFKNEEYICNSEAFYVLENSKPKKSCPKCSEIGYHSNIFDLDWIIRCPVHNCTLLYHCPKCHKEWPSLKELSNRRCSCCGIGVKINKILEKYQPQTVTYKIMHSYLQQIKHHRLLNDKFITFNAKKPFKQLSEVNTLSAYTLPALEMFGLLNVQTDLDFKKISDIDLIPVKHSYRCTKLSGKEISNFLFRKRHIIENPFDADFDNNFHKKIKDIKYKTLIKTLEVLSKFPSYRHLPSTSFNLNSYQQSKTWTEINNLLFPDPSIEMELEGLKENHLKKGFPKLITHIAYCPKEYEKDFDFKFIGEYQNSVVSKLLCSDKLEVFQIPIEFTLKLFEIDLWIFINKMLFDLIQKNHNTQIDCFNEYLHDSNLNGRMLFSSIFLNKEPNFYNLEISYPKNLLDESILDSLNYRKMLTKQIC